MKKLVGPIFSRIIEHHKSHGKSCKGLQGFLTSIVQDIWSFLQDLRSREPKFSKLKLPSRKKKFWPIFSTVTHYDRHWVFFCYAPQGILAIIVQVLWSFLWELKRLFKTHIFRKKAIFSVKKGFCPVYFRIFERKKPQETIYKIQKDILQLVWKEEDFFRT